MTDNLLNVDSALINYLKNRKSLFFLYTHEYCKNKSKRKVAYEYEVLKEHNKFFFKQSFIFEEHFEEEQLINFLI